MYWDVVEVKAEPEHTLFVRFKDGLSGRLPLRQEDMTGALDPLRDATFFEQVFIDEGAVAWPLNIDLAPDAMYREVAARATPEGIIGEPALRQRWPRLFDLGVVLKDDLFNRLARESFDPVERSLQVLEPGAWETLKGRALRYASENPLTGQGANRGAGNASRGRQQLFDVLSEAVAYGYLLGIGCSRLQFVQEREARTPDLEGALGQTRLLCEVKTINVSDEERRFRSFSREVRDAENCLTMGFLNKLDQSITKAKSQMDAYDPSARHLVFLVIDFDDFSSIYLPEYVKQITQHLASNPPSIKVVGATGFSGRLVFET